MADRISLQNLVERPRESLDCELKAWLDLDDPGHQSKVIKACIALRNHGGGFLIIGIDNESQSVAADAPDDSRLTYSTDNISQLVLRYARPSFEITVNFVPRDDIDIPVIEVAPGVETPVFTIQSIERPKSYTGPKKSPLLQADVVYVRSLSASNSPGTKKADPADWNELLRVCFRNREADIGSFISRYVPELSRAFADAARPSALQSATDAMDRLTARFDAALASRNISLDQWPDHRGYFDVAVAIDGEVPSYEPNKEFYRKLRSRGTRPSRGFDLWGLSDETHSWLLGEAWHWLVSEQFTTQIAVLAFGHLSPSGVFSMRSALGEDLLTVGGYGAWGDSSPEPLTVFDPLWAIGEIAVVMAGALDYARNLGCRDNETDLVFVFRWTRLAGRRLASVFDRSVFFRQGANDHAVQDELVTESVTVPLPTDASALAPFVHKVANQLTRLFGGHEYDRERVASEVAKWYPPRGQG